MPFTSASFLYFFLPLTLMLYFAVPRCLKNPVLVLAGLVFFFWGEPRCWALLPAAALAGYGHGLWIEKARGRRWQSVPLLSALAVHAGLLFLVRYTDILRTNANSFFRAEPALRFLLPLGVGVFTLQVLSYCLDLYRGRAVVQRSFSDFAAYVCLFPVLIAGPIVPYRQIEGQLRQRGHSWAGAAAGIRTFVIGLAKKVILGNTLAQVGYICARLEQPTVLFHWLAAAAFVLQIYYDLSGYSDMALGLLRTLGFQVPRNFNYPLAARSITGFWQRWFISLGTWVRDYIYAPLAGRTAGGAREAAALLAAGVLLGMWHGPGWNMLAWGLVFAGLILLERLFLGRVLNRLPRCAGHVYVLLVLVVNFTLFRAPGLQGGLASLRGMLGLAGLPWSSPETIFYLRSFSFTLVLAALGAVPLLPRLAAAVRRSRAGERALSLLEPVLLIALFLLATGCLIDGYFSPYAFFKL